MDNQPMCNCLGCQTAAVGKQIHLEFEELREMINSRDRRLDEVYRIAGNAPPVDLPPESVARISPRKGGY